jgi:hypothetical protein
MVTNTEGYMQLIEYLTENLSLFESTQTDLARNGSIIASIEEELGEQIISVCSQNEALTSTMRNTIVSEIDTIMYDLEEILSGVVNNRASTEQLTFINEFATLIKNLFDAEIHSISAQ